MADQEMLVGVHVTPGGLEVAVHPAGSTWHLPNDEAGLRDLTARLEKMNPKIVLLAAYRGPALSLVAELAVAALPVALVAPAELAKYRRRADYRTKTDGLASWILARYAQEKKPEVRAFKCADILELEKLNIRQQQLNVVLLEERQALAQTSGALLSRIQDHISRLEDDLNVIGRDLEKVIMRSPVWPKPFSTFRNWLRETVSPSPMRGMASGTSLLVSLILLGAAAYFYPYGSNPDNAVSTTAAPAQNVPDTKPAARIQLSTFFASLGGITLGGAVSVVLGGTLLGLRNQKRLLLAFVAVGLAGVLVSTVPALHDQEMLRALEPYSAAASALAGSALGIWLGLLPQETI